MATIARMYYKGVYGHIREHYYSWEIAKYHVDIELDNKLISCDGNTLNELKKQFKIAIDAYQHQ